MSTSPGPQGVPPSAASITAQRVIEMFADLNLPVCDDPSAIQQKVDEQRDRRLKEKNSTDGRTRANADRWFADVDAMRDTPRRGALLQVVYEFFKDLATNSMSVAAASRQFTITQDVIDNLMSTARKQCRVDESLAHTFVEDYLREKGYLQGRLVSTSLVENFSATAGPGRISLTWALPPKDCDQVEIVREATGAVKAAGKTETVYQGNSSSFVDTHASVGVSYIYRAYTLHKTFRSSDFRETRVTSLGPVGVARQDYHLGRWLLGTAATVGVLSIGYFIWQLRPPEFTPARLHASEAVLQNEFRLFEQSLPDHVCALVREASVGRSFTQGDRLGIIERTMSEKTALESLWKSGSQKPSLNVTRDGLATLVRQCTETVR